MVCCHFLFMNNYLTLFCLLLYLVLIYAGSQLEKAAVSDKKIIPQSDLDSFDKPGHDFYLVKGI